MVRREITILGNSIFEGDNEQMKKQILITVLATSLFFTQDAKAAEIQFKDVAKTNPYYEIIHQMRDQKIISGYENGMFKPNENIQRKHGAALVSRAVELPATTSYVAFKDVSTSNANHAAIKELQMAGIFKADSKGNFNPNVDMTRGEMAKVIATAFNLNVEKTDKSSFKDVKANSEYSPYIEALAKANITTGYGDGTFKPTGSLSRAHFAVFMHRAMEFKETGNVTGSDAVTPAPKPVTPPKEETKPPTTGTTTVTVQKGTAVLYNPVGGGLPDEIKSYPAELPFQGIELMDLVNMGRDKNNPLVQAYSGTHAKNQEKSADEIDTKFMNTSRTGRHSAADFISTKDVQTIVKGIQSVSGLSESEIHQIINWSASTGGVFYNEDVTVYVKYNGDAITLNSWK